MTLEEKYNELHDRVMEKLEDFVSVTNTLDPLCFKATIETVIDDYIEANGMETIDAVLLLLDMTEAMIRVRGSEQNESN